MEDMILKSSAFKHEETIPIKYTCESDDVNPMLEIRNVPEHAKSLVIVVDDPDATNGDVWDHWLLWNINPKTQYISEDNIPDDAVLGKTSFGHMKYGGPCPPRGKQAHRYMFKLYALDTILDLKPGSEKAELERAMEGHILNQTLLMGRFTRS